MARYARLEYIYHKFAVSRYEIIGFDNERHRQPRAKDKLRADVATAYLYAKSSFLATEDPLLDRERAFELVGDENERKKEPLRVIEDAISIGLYWAGYYLAKRVRI